MQNTFVPNAVGRLTLSNKLQKLKYLLGLMLCIFGVGFTALAAPSDLDPTFGVGGKVVSNPGGSGLPGYDMALQPDGKIVMVGGFANSGINFVVARYNSDGSLDAGFGSGGSVSLSFGGTYEIGYAVAVQPDGKIVVCGTSRTPITSENTVIARLNSNGSLDTTFDGDGKVSVAFTLNSVSRPAISTVVKIANDGKIVFAGYSPDLNSVFYRLMGRLNSDGSLDTSFNGNGRLLDGSNGIWTDLIVRSDNTIFAAGYNYFQTNPTQFTDLIIASKVTDYGAYAGTYSRGQNFQSSKLYGVAEQPDGKIVAVGKLNGKIFAMRFTAAGTFDETFTEAVIASDGQARSVAIQPDGKIVASISFGFSTNGFSLVRYNPNGSFDNGFGNGGIIITGSGGEATGRKVVIQPDGKILVGGNNGGGSFVIMRYLGGASAPLKTMFDYDGDGKADVSVFRPSENRWYILKSSDSSFAQTNFGTAGDVPTPADYDGDGKTDVAIWRPADGVWWYLSSVSGAQIAAQWGQNGDIPRPSDFDGDGKTDYVVFRPSDSKWYRLGNTGGSSVVAFGAAGDKPVIGDFDGDGKSDPAIYRPSTGVWWYAASGSSNAQRAVQFGIATDVPVPADYDGDGKTDFAVYRAAEGGWHILNGGNGNYTAFPFGTSEDKPVAADYDGDGKVDAGVYRPSNGGWYLLRSTSGFSGVQWGSSNDIPTENSFIQ